MKLHNELRLTIRQHQAKFGSHTSSGVRNNWFLGCYVNLCDQVVRRPTLVAKRDRKGDILFLICSRDHVVMWCYGWILLILVIATQVLGHFLVENTWLTCNNMCWPVTCESWASTSVRKYKTNTFDESFKFLHWLFLVTSDGFRSFLVVLSWFKLF